MSKFEQSQIAVLGLTTRIARVRQRALTEVKKDEIRAKVEAFGDPAPEATHTLQTELDAFKSVVYTAMVEQQDNGKVEKILASVSSYFQKMHPLVTDATDLQRCYTGFVAQHEDALNMPKWEEVEDQIKPRSLAGTAPELPVKQNGI